MIDPLVAPSPHLLAEAVGFRLQSVEGGLWLSPPISCSREHGWKVIPLIEGSPLAASSKPCSRFDFFARFFSDRPHRSFPALTENPSTTPRRKCNTATRKGGRYSLPGAPSTTLSYMFSRI